MSTHEIEEQKPTNYFEQLRKNWVIIVFLAGLIVGWTNIQNQIRVNLASIEQTKLDVVALSVKVEAAQTAVSNINGDIKEIKASLSFIKDRLTRQ